MRRKRGPGEEEERTGRGGRQDWARRKRGLGQEEDRTGPGGREDWARRKRGLGEEEERTGLAPHPRIMLVLPALLN